MDAMQRYVQKGRNSGKTGKPLISRSPTTTSLDEYELMSDAKYRTYVQQMDRALKGFEYTSEWADLVNALGKLNKVLSNNVKYNVIPRRFTVGQRLAQCMHPALPSGVHLKALETYDFIFKCIGTDRLIQELSIYSNGLFPLLSHAAINVKPSLLEIYEKHFIPLGTRLTPALDGFLIAILPGLEENDCHERTDKLLVEVCNAVSQEFFYGSLWRCVLNNPSVRFHAIMFITSHFNKKRSLEDQLYIMGTCLQTMITGICAALLDTSNVLVQRAILDLLLSCFPMHNKQIARQDLISITTAAITVLLRRDVSLNRRFTQWLTAEDSSNPKSRREATKLAKAIGSDKSYFETFAKELVLDAFKICLIDPSNLIPIPNSWSSLGDLWPYRLLICLIDHREISHPIIDNLCLEILRALYHEFGFVGNSHNNNSYNINNNNNKTLKADLIRTSNLLFTNIGINYLWHHISQLFSHSCEHYIHFDSHNNNRYVKNVGFESITIVEMCTLVNFVLDNVSVEATNFNENTSQSYLTQFLLHVLNCLITHSSILHSIDFEHSIKLCSNIINKIKPTITQTLENRRKSDTKDLKAGGKILQKVESVIREEGEDNESHPLPEGLIDDELFQKCLISTLQTFFVEFVENRLVKDKTGLNECFASLRVSSINSDREVINFETQIRSIDINADMINVYTNLCQLLVQMSAIPALSDKKTTKLQFSSCDELQQWFQHLLVLSIYPKDCLQVCYTSISSVLDLITLTKALLFDLPVNQTAVTANGSPVFDFSTNDNSKDNNKGFHFDPMISANELAFIFHQTSWFTQATTKLWSNFEDSKAHLHLETATLLQQLHNLAVDSSICESVICTSMISPDETVAYESRKRFTVLYNITRDLKMKSMPSAMAREFDRPLFFMLDSLSNKVDSHNAQAIDWLNQSLKCGDIARILEPLLFIILHPDTSRLSVQHANIHQPGISCIADTNCKSVDEIDNASIANSESKIYAISSTGGNVIYHVNSDGRMRFTPSPVPSNKVLTLTQTANNSNSLNKWITQKVHLSQYEVPPSHENNIMDKYMSINMVLNPFGSMSSLNSDAFEIFDSNSVPFARSLPNLSNIRRLDTKSIKSDNFMKSPTPYSTPVPSRTTTTCSTPVPLKKIMDDSELTDNEIVVSVLEEVIDKVVYDLEDSSESEDSQTAITNSETISVGPNSRPVSLSQLHSHMLLYQQVYDSKRTLYALTTLWNIILAEPQRVLFAMATTSISNRLGLRSQELQALLSRHRNSIYGKGFYSDLSSESITSFRSSSFLEVVVSACMQYLRSYYPSLPQTRLNEEEIAGNQKVRIVSCEVLRLIFNQLSVAIKGKQTFSTYLYDLLMRCKIQKTLLQCIVSSVYNFMEKKEKEPTNTNDSAFADALIEFNECHNSTNGFQEDLQKSLLKLLEELMILEHKVSPNLSDKEQPTHNRKGSDSRAARIRFQPQMSSLKYYPNMLIPAQSMFLSAIQTALQQSHKVHLHSNWLDLVEATLSYAGRSLSRLVVCVLTQLCQNLESTSNKITMKTMKDDKTEMSSNYLIVLLKSLATLCHFCLLDTSGTPSSPTLQPQTQAINPNSATLITSSSNPFSMFTNFLHVFSVSESSQESSTLGRDSNNDPLISTRKTVLTHLPRVLSALLMVWKQIKCTEKEELDNGWQIMGSSREVKQNILTFLSPLSLIHGSHFMTSVAIVWYDMRDNNGIKNRKQWSQSCSTDQLLLVELVAAIRVLPMESVLQTIRQAIKAPPNANSSKHMKRPPIEVCMLQFFLAYIKAFPGSQLLECWKSVLSLLKDGLQISTMAQPLVQFHLLAILHEFVQAAPLIEDRKDQKDLQDVAQKLVDACTTVAGARLGQTKWLRRNLEVIPGPQADQQEDDESNNLDNTFHTIDSINGNIDYSNISDADNSFLSKFSVQALCALAEFVAPVLDVVYVSEEKEKVVPLVQNIMYYIVPYLKNRTKHNAPSFRACSHLLSNISGYQYTRKAWRKDAFELLLDPTFFQLDSENFGYWKTIIDHLMTHDKNTFREFLARMSVTQSGGALKMFSNKDQEIEQRAHLVKRLALILFCSEKDQYQKYMSEIQEKLIESHRLSQSPLVQAQVLLCFRVIILRMSAHHLTSLWPFIYTEMFQVFLHIEMELMSDTPEFNAHIQRLSNLDSSWVTSQSNGLAAHNNPQWLQLYLAACKLLDIAIALPADSLPQFQMYRWAFVCGNKEPNTMSNGVNRSSLHPNGNPITTPFEPHIVRINNLMHTKNPEVETIPYRARCPLITKTSIKSLQELHPFFHTLLKSSLQTSTQSHQLNDPLMTSVSLDDALAFIDKIVEIDFFDSIPNL
ncbi:protein dopey-1-like isoform X2 [Oppia nitens]|uniref:protein dopey-1-like isoform X2 n=1 Tax=Oppia nitens TaxID=1686743 RepID=UPI0023DB0678|nr:protein dopey-1-like isoform X2 [Oppia nitens]